MKSVLGLSFVVLTYDREEMLRQHGVVVPTTILAFEKDASDVFCQLRNLEGYKERTIVPNAFCPAITLNTTSDSFTKVDDFGDEFEFVYAKQTRNLQMDYNLRHKAIKAYLDALPDNTRIVLYWHLC